jgi:hypothetical protein
MSPDFRASVIVAPESAVSLRAGGKEVTMDLVTFDALVFSAMTCILVREAMIAWLPDTIAGPGGWLVDTRADD